MCSRDRACQQDCMLSRKARCFPGMARIAACIGACKEKLAHAWVLLVTAACAVEYFQGRFAGLMCVLESI